MATKDQFQRCDLTNDAISRYGRQLILRGWGVEAQEKVSKAKVLIVGAGGLGCPSALYLAGSGVASLGIVDHDMIERSNLHRQVAHHDANVGSSKAQSLVQACRDLNPIVSYTAYEEKFMAENAERIAGKIRTMAWKLTVAGLGGRWPQENKADTCRMMSVTKWGQIWDGDGIWIGFMTAWVMCHGV